MFGWISFLQTLFFTLIVIVLLQIKIGESTLEQKTIQWYRTSNLVAPIQEVANGGAKLVRDIVNKVASSLDIQLFEKMKNQPGQRDVQFQLERSKRYLEEQTRRAAQRIQQELQSEKQAEPIAAPENNNRDQVYDWE